MKLGKLKRFEQFQQVGTIILRLFSDVRRRFRGHGRHGWAADWFDPVANDGEFN